MLSQLNTVGRSRISPVQWAHLDRLYQMNREQTPGLTVKSFYQLVERMVKEDAVEVRILGLSSGELPKLRAFQRHLKAGWTTTTTTKQSVAGAVTEKEAAIVTAVTEKEAVVAEKEVAVTTKEDEATIAKKEAALATKEAAVAEKEAAVAKKEAALAEKEAAFATREAAFAKKEAALATKEATFAKKEAAFAEREAIVAKKEAVLATKGTNEVPCPVDNNGMPQESKDNTALDATSVDSDTARGTKDSAVPVPVDSPEQDKAVFDSCVILNCAALTGTQLAEKLSRQQVHESSVESFISPSYSPTATAQVGEPRVPLQECPAAHDVQPTVSTLDPLSSSLAGKGEDNNDCESPRKKQRCLDSMDSTIFPSKEATASHQNVHQAPLQDGSGSNTAGDNAREATFLFCAAATKIERQGPLLQQGEGLDHPREETRVLNDRGSCFQQILGGIVPRQARYRSKVGPQNEIRLNYW